MKILRFFLQGIIIQVCFIISLYGQIISGTVISKFYGSLPGVSIWVPKTNIGTVTDLNGNYSITIDSNYNILCYCIVGFECQEVIINKDTIINITLEELPIELNEIIINGVYVRKRHNPQGRIIKSNGLFRKPDTIIVGVPDTTFNRLETERKRKILDSINTNIINDSINFLENLTSVEKDFRKYVIDSIEYPETSLNNYISGRVYVRFTINEESRISDIIVFRSVEPELDNEVISVLEQMPIQIQMEFGEYSKYYNRQIPKKYILRFRFELIEM